MFDCQNTADRLFRRAASDPDTTMHDSEESDSRDDWIIIQHKYRSIFSKILRLKKDKEERLYRSDELHNNLREWVECLPSPYRDISTTSPTGMRSNTRKLQIFCQYHEAILRLYLQKISKPNDSSDSFQSAMTSAQTIIGVASALPNQLMLIYRYVIKQRAYLQIFVTYIF